MYDNSLELAENKLLLLYILKNIRYPISNSQLTDIVLENNLINYFLLQQYLSQLISSEFLKYEESNEKQLICMTEKGEKVLSFFQDRISEKKIKLIDEYIKNCISNIKKELTITADYIPENNDTFIVKLKAVENETLLLDLRVSVGSKKQAISLCAKWKENPSDIYTKIISALIEN